MTQRFRGLGALVSLALLGASIATFVLGRKVADTYASRAWLRHVGGRSTSATEARQATRRAVAALDMTAPLPAAGEATRRSLEIIRQSLRDHPQMALELSAQIRQALERRQASWRGWGLGDALATARDLESQARTAAATAAERKP